MIPQQLKKHISQSVQQLFYRPQNSGFDCIDGLRGFSMVWILLAHCYYIIEMFTPHSVAMTFKSSWAHRSLSQAHMAVDLFFTLSGFLVGYYIFLEYKNNNTINVKDFYLRRAFRLLPPYYIALFLYWLVTTGPLETIWANLLYINNLIPFDKQFMGWTWTVAVEEQFYITFPIFALLLLKYIRKPLSILIGALAFSFAYRFYIINKFGITFPTEDALFGDQQTFAVFFNNLYLHTFSRFGPILIGVIGAYLVIYTKIIEIIEQKVIFRQTLIFIGFFTFVFFILLMPFDFIKNWLSDHSTFYLTTHRNLASIGFCGLILFSFTSFGKKHPLIQFFASSRWYFFSKTSYSAYLVHFMLITLVYRHINVADQFSHSKMIYLIPIVFLVTFTVAVLMYVFVEAPFMLLRKKYITKGQMIRN